jgi:hypothetical protein
MLTTLILLRIQHPIMVKTPKRRSSRKTKATPKKKQATADAARKAAEADEEEVLATPPARSKAAAFEIPKDDGPAPKALLFSDDEDEDDEEANSDVKAFVLRNLSDDETAHQPGRMWFVSCGKDFNISDNIASVTDIAVSWFVLVDDVDDGDIDPDSVYVSVADSFTDAMAVVKQRGAVNMVTEVARSEDGTPQMPSPAEGTTGNLKLYSEESPRTVVPVISSKFACSPSSLAPAIRLVPDAVGSAVPAGGGFAKATSSPAKKDVAASSSLAKVTNETAKHRKASTSTALVANPYAKAKGGPVAVKTEKRLDLSGAVVDVSMIEELADHQAKMRQQLADGGTHQYFHVSGIGPYFKDGRVHATGIIDLVNSGNKQYWTFKPSAFSVAMTAASFSTDQLAHLRQMTSTFHTVLLRRHPHGKNMPKKTPANGSGRSYNIEAIAFHLDLTPFLSHFVGTQDESDLEEVASMKLAEVLGDVHQVFVSKLFIDAFQKSMASNARTSKFFLNTVSKDDNLRELATAIRTSKLKLDFPSPLSTHLMDEDISEAMKVVAGTSNPAEWSEEERALAYKDGNLPDEVDLETGNIIFE